MLQKEQIQQAIAQAVDDVRDTNPMAGSITNTVSVNLVANAQLAVGGSAAMVYLPDEGEFLAAAGGAFYINMGTLLPVYEQTLPQTARALHGAAKPWVLDPVGIGIGSLRTQLLQQLKDFKPTVVRCNASEAIALADLWQLASSDASGVRGVDSTDTVQSAQQAAVAIARYTQGAVAVSGETDLVTDGTQVVLCEGGSPFMEKITGAGCSLGGVAAVYSCVTSPFIAALAATNIYNLAGIRAGARSSAPASFQVAFLDELYLAAADDVSAAPFYLMEA